MKTIPLGAKDSELQGWTYTIPEGMEAEIIAGQIIVKKKKSKDEQIKEALISYLNEIGDTGVASFNGFSIKEYITYLEKQKPSEWNEEDEHRCKDAIYFLETAKKHYADTSEIELTIEWLKSLRPQPKKELSIEKAIKWLDDTFYFLDNSSGRGRDCEITTHEFNSLEEMYDSFRKAVIVDSEPHWKPSEEQKPETKHTEVWVEGRTIFEQDAN